MTRRIVWRWVVIATGALMLCACRSVTPGSGISGTVTPAPVVSAGASARNQEASIARVSYQFEDSPPQVPPPAASAPTRLPARQLLMHPPAAVHLGPSAPVSHGAHCPHCRPASPSSVLDRAAAPGPCGPGWVPPDIRPPWREDEFICDGGDQGLSAVVRQDWSVAGLEPEDTILHYDTLDGETHVVPSNKVCLYAPRFAAVRKIYGIIQYDGHLASAGVEQPQQLERLDDVGVPTTVIQPLQPGRNIGTDTPFAFRDRLSPEGVDNSQLVLETLGELLPYQDFVLIKRGEMDASEKARLADRIQAAAAWSIKQGAQVVIDNLVANEDVSVTAAGELAYYEVEGKSRVRICKIASKGAALPGEEVEFTLRFDNVGERVVGNVTILDNLTPRLEYIEGSQKCTLDANFSTDWNEAESLKLRWEITKPIPVGKGGVITFRCRVR